MNSNAPIVRGSISWPAFFAQLSIIGILYYLFSISGFREPFLMSALAYVILARILRASIAKNHRHGMRLVKQKKYIEAIPFFEKSYNFFTENSWVDKFRFLTLLSSVKNSYAQMGLDNIAFCYGQSGNGVKAMEYYKRSLELNPDDGVAQAGLNMLQSVDNLNVTNRDK